MARYSLEKLIEHKFIDRIRSGAIQLMNGFVLWPIAVQRAKLAASIAEQNEKVFGFAARYFVQHLHFGITIDDARKDTVFDRIQDDSAI